MKFYRRLTHIKALSFDLDDTLYANRPVMIAAEEKMLQYFSSHCAEKLLGKNQGILLNRHYWNSYRSKAIEQTPSLADDVVAHRLESYYLGAFALGYPSAQARIIAQKAMDYFAYVRSDFVVPESAHQLLKLLSQHYPLVAISNGNVDTKAIGIDHYFKYVFHATSGIKQKPHEQMFKLACHKLAILPQYLLHVGDCGSADIKGAIAAGCQVAWLSCYDLGKPLSVLPQLELSDITKLADLLL